MVFGLGSLSISLFGVGLAVANLVKADVIGTKYLCQVYCLFYFDLFWGG
jgi:hypothetical protein